MSRGEPITLMFTRDSVACTCACTPAPRQPGSDSTRGEVPSNPLRAINQLVGAVLIVAAIDVFLAVHSLRSTWLRVLFFSEPASRCTRRAGAQGATRGLFR